MSVTFDPTGVLNIAMDASDLPQTGDGTSIASDALTRCKNLRLNQAGVAKTRDGSAKVNESAIGDTDIYWIEEQGGSRYTFAGTSIYLDETSIETDLTSAQWTAVKYNAFNDTTQQVFALNGTDRKRIDGEDVYEWGIEAPTVAPVLTAGTADGSLTGQYNARYTYIRKVGSTVVDESNPSPSAPEYLGLAGESLLVDVELPTDPQVTHIRLYRTQAFGVIYYRDQDVPLTAYSYGHSYAFEADDAYFAGNGFKFTIEGTSQGTENTHSWESVFQTSSEAATSQNFGGNAWYDESAELQQQWLEWSMGAGRPQ